MDEVREALIFLFADAIDNMQFGRKERTREVPKGEWYRGSPGMDLQSEFGRINNAIIQGRILGFIPDGAPAFSREEKTVLAREIRAYGKLGLPAKTRELLIAALQVRGISEELIASISLEIDEISAEMKARKKVELGVLDPLQREY